MGSFTEVSEPIIDVKFRLKRDSQKFLIDYILSYSKLDSIELAEILEVNPLKVSRVLAGKDYFESRKARNLFGYFSMLVGH